MVRVKVCCIQSIEEARTALEMGIHALGLVGPMPSGPGPISLERIREIASFAPPGIATVLLTSSQTVEEICSQVRLTGVNTLQLVDRVAPQTFATLRQQFPGLKIIQVIHVMNNDAVAEATSIAPKVDALLLDSGNPNLTLKELGGTGRVHDWSVSRRIVEECRRPVFLAGGLNPDNVSAAVERVQPYGVDICSGLRQEGRLVPELLQDFLRCLT